jgi:hypothetical protein
MPITDDIQIWRYFSFPKFVNWLTTNALYFTRLDQFDDRLEGVLLESAIAKMENVKAHDLLTLLWPHFEPELHGDQLPKMLSVTPADISASDYMKKLFQGGYASCWCCHEHESFAMWKVYLNGEQGVAVRTTVNTLKAAMQVPTGFKLTDNRVDYYAEQNQTGNIFNPIFYKRPYFNFEQEYRFFLFGPNKYTGILVPTSPADAIQEIRIQATAPEWFSETLTELLDRFYLNLPVTRSDLYRSFND